jgi:hypothetical protein
MVAPSNFTKFANVAYVMNSALSEMGLPVPSSGQFVGSQDQTVVQMLGLLSSAGQDLCTMFDWQFLHKTFTLNLVVGQTLYPLPADWNGFVNDTFWNNTTRLPLIGPVPPSIWRMLNQIELYNPAQATDMCQADYYSRGWLQDSTNPTIYRDNAQNDSDILLLDSRLLVLLLKLRWREAKKFDTTTELQDFTLGFDAITGRDTPGARFSLGARQSYPYLGYQNIPDSGYGRT